MTNIPHAAQEDFVRSIDALASVFGFVRRFFKSEHVAKKHLRDVEFAVEEMFTNMVKYNSGNPNNIVIRMELVENRLAVRLIDVDVDPFDVSEQKDLPVDLPLEQRKPGGLGIQLTKKLMDDVKYEYRDRRGTTTLIKIIG